MKIPSSQRQPLNKTNGGGGEMGEASAVFLGGIEMGRFAFGGMGRHGNCCIFAN